MGFELVATRGTTRYINDLGLRCDPISKVMQGSPLVVNLMREGRGAMVNNTTEADTNKDSFSIRRTTLELRLPFFTTLAPRQRSPQSPRCEKATPVAAM
jgi:carbamoyl-phosphate synthase large subunit